MDVERESNGYFKKGSGGRPKGAKNQRTKQWDALGESIMNEHTERFNAMLAKLDEKEFGEMYLKVLEYFKPKLSRSEVKADVSNKHQPVQLTADEYRKMIENENTDLAWSGFYHY